MATRVIFQSEIVEVSANTITFTDEADPTWQGIVYRLASARPDMIVYGCLLALVNRSIPRPVPETLLRWVRVLGALAWVAFFAFIAFANRVPGFELFGGWFYQVALLLLAPMILDLYLRQQSRPARLLSLPALRWLGVRSYGIYLWHIPVLYFFLAMMDGVYGVRRLVIGLVGAGVGVLAGIASYRYIELRFLRLKDARFRRPQDEATGVGSSADSGSTSQGSAPS